MTQKGNFELSGWGFLKIRTQEKLALLLKCHLCRFYTPGTNNTYSAN